LQNSHHHGPTRVALVENHDERDTDLAPQQRHRGSRSHDLVRQAGHSDDQRSLVNTESMEADGRGRCVRMPRRHIAARRLDKRLVLLDCYRLERIVASVHIVALS
jgi:hypothetical protein